VIRGQFPREQALGWDRDIVDYVESNRFFENYRGPGDDVGCQLFRFAEGHEQTTRLQDLQSFRGVIVASVRGNSPHGRG
jgi:hypothetical protein